MVCSAIRCPVSRVLTLAVGTVLLLGLGVVPAAHASGPNAIRNLAGFAANTMGANDDGSTGAVATGFNANFFGTTYANLYVNNNGNVTFGGSLGTYTPFGLTTASGTKIIAPFFADVDTRGAGSGVVTYGTDTVGGHAAFGADWINVGYFGARTDKLNSFQLVLIDRSDVAAGDFDIEMNYDQILWETGDASGGSGGLGGSSAHAGYSAGTGVAGTFFEFPGSGVNGAFLDSNPTTDLIGHSRNSSQLGRYFFSVRNGAVLTGPDAAAKGAQVASGGAYQMQVRVFGDNHGDARADVTITLVVTSNTGGSWSAVPIVASVGAGNPFAVTFNVRPPSGRLSYRACASADGEVHSADDCVGGVLVQTV